MNIKLLRRIQKQILKEPRQFDMSAWFMHDLDEIPNCGTSACIAGWAITLEAKLNPSKASRKFYRSGGAVFVRAKRLLRLDHIQAGRLFYGENWPEKFQTQSHKSAVKRIDHFIATKGAE